MKYRQYRIPLVFGGLLTIFVLGVFLLQQLTQPEEVTQVVSQKVEPVQTTLEKKEEVICPVSEDVEIVRYFYEVDGEHNQEALDYFEGVYRQSLGIDYGSEKTFDVLASLSGTVEDVKKDAILGLCVTIQCDEGISLIYQSLANVQLEEGQTVRQGDVLGQSGYNVYEAELGNHVHFTIEKDNEPINPLTVIKS
jgi:stage II sporulation protein Q